MTVPECVHIPPLPEPLQSQTHSILSMVRQDRGPRGGWCLGQAGVGSLGGQRKPERGAGVQLTLLPAASTGPGSRAGAGRSCLPSTYDVHFLPEDAGGGRCPSGGPGPPGAEHSSRGSPGLRGVGVSLGGSCTGVAVGTES